MLTVRCSRWNRSHTTRAFPAITCSFPLRKPCRSCPTSAIMRSTALTSKVGPSTQSDWAKTLGFIRIPIQTTDASPMKCCVLSASSLILASTTSIGRASKMVDFFHEHSSEDEPDVQAETDRYIVWPAQALGYKLGQLEILKLRERAQTELGSKYDIRAFHDEILNGGALPLDVLDARVTAWIEAQKDRMASAK